MSGFMVGGVFTVPSSAGDVVIPRRNVQAAVFMGTNFTTEDTIVTSTGTGLFRGMIGPKYDDPGTIYQNASSASPAGDAHAEDNYAILCVDTTGNGTILYRATVTIGANEVTASFDTAPAGGYQIIYLLLVNFDNVGALVENNNTVTLGWKAESSLVHGGGTGLVASSGVSVQDCYGGGAYPGSVSSGWKGAYVTNFTFPTSSGQQFFIEKASPVAANRVGFGGHFLGPFLITGSWTGVPSGGGLNDFSASFDSGFNTGMTVVWDGPSDTGQITPGQDQGDIASKTGLAFDPGAVLTYSLSAEGGGQSSGAAVGAIGLSLTTPDFHWCVTIDGFGFGGFGRGAFQSFQRDWVDVVNGTQVHAGTMVLGSNRFDITTEEDSATKTNLVWHAFGYPLPRVAMVPQLYRRRVA